MGTTAEKINRLTQTKSDLKTVINYTGANITDETTFKEYPKLLNKAYIDILNNGTDDLYEALPKTTATGSDLTLNTEEGKMKLIPKAVQIQQNTSILPSGYTQVDYIESSGTQFIDTLFYPTPQIKIESYFEFTDVSRKQQRLFGIGNSDSNGLVITFYINGSGNFAWACQNNTGNWTSTGKAANVNKNFITIDSLNDSVNLANLYNQTITSTRTNTSTKTLLLFGHRGDLATIDTSTISFVKMYSTKIYDNNVLVRDFIPCYRNSDNEVGLYDLVNDVFYTNQGTGAFTYGSVVDIPNPDYPQEIKVVTGEQNIQITGKNLFKPVGQTSKGITAIVNEDGSISYSGTSTADYSNLTTRFYKDLPAGKYTLSINKALNYEVRIRLYYEDGTYQPFTIYAGNTSRTFSVSKKIKSCYEYIGSLQVGVEYNDTLYIQFESGELTPYEPYQEQNYPISLSSKNLLDYHWFGTSKDILWQYYYESLGQNDFRAISIYIGIGNYATFSTNVPQTTPSLLYAINDINQGSTDNSPLNSTVVRTIQANSEGYVYLGFVNTRQYYADVANGTYYIQIEIGSTATEYVPYHEPIEYCKIGDYADQFFKNTTDSEFYDSTLLENEWYLKKNIGKVIFDGSENWQQEGDNGFISITNAFGQSSKTYTNYFNSVSTVTNLWGDVKFGGSNNNLIFYKAISENTDLVGWKSWLSLHNTTVYYQLATPTYIHISQADYPVLRSQLENLYNNVKSYEDKTYITITNDNEENLLLNVDVSALAKIE